MQLEVLTPEKLLYKGMVDIVNLPGEDGRFGIMNNHAPIISVLQSGEVEVVQSTEQNKSFDDLSGDFITDVAKDQRFTFEVKGGVVEVVNNKVIVLAE